MGAPEPDRDTLPASEMTVGQMHAIARFNRPTPCPFCFAEWQARAQAQARPPSRRVNRAPRRRP